MISLLSKESEWLLKIIMGVSGLIVVHFFLVGVIRYFKRKAFDKENIRKELDYILIAPIKYILFVIGIFFILDVSAKKLEFFSLCGYLKIMRNVFIVIGVTWFFLRWKQKAFQIFLDAQKKAKNFDPGSLQFLQKIITVLIVFLSMLAILQVIGMNIFPLLAFGGIGAAALGFAAKDVIANFIGSFMLHITKPFTLGDFIEIPGKNLKGTVEEIGWYFTLVRDLDKSLLYLPNALFSSVLLINTSRCSHRKIEEKVKICLEDFSKVSQFLAAVQSFIHHETYFDHKLDILVYIEAINDEGIAVRICAYTFATELKEFVMVQQKVLEKITEILYNLHIKRTVNFTQFRLVKDL